MTDEQDVFPASAEKTMENGVNADPDEEKFIRQERSQELADAYEKSTWCSE